MSTSTSGAKRLASSSGQTGDPLIRAEGIWKIFGKNASKVIGTPDAHLSRAELREKTGLRRSCPRRLVRGLAR